MANSNSDVCFVTACCARDVHYAKALLASISYFHPGNGIIVLADVDVPARDRKQLNEHPRTEVVDVNDVVRENGLGLSGLLTKLNLLLLKHVPRVLFCDADSILVAPVLAEIDPRDVFIAFDGHLVDRGDPVQMRSFERWAVSLDDVRAIDSAFGHGPLVFLQSSHFFVDVREFPTNELFEKRPWLNVDHRESGPFRAGDQGFWNYVVNKHFHGHPGFRWCQRTLAADRDQEISIERRHQSLAGVPQAGPGAALFVHYLGFTRTQRWGRHKIADPLLFFRKRYYADHLASTFMVDEVIRLARWMGRSAARRIRSWNGGHVSVQTIF